ncbi:DUF983 domain-containing protein [Siccirubricoccus sp. KC 17139]|uniref:DUF983 domain-containing protein n=1 Tax=Siccirubricoccus soli TaxID=2899147 RepID=A0ABT1D299_9PROT|nr:DUF983 domain-containing protein [Siccirubricoccus soli]MCO6416049.1 DUF983 domain-containing protein [Siccirubricoccus soli]MCP2682181.1 DUF983 domain-containing protein [Siccirubricoccus soli]
MRWDASRLAPTAAYAPPPLWTAVSRGLGNHCPFCAEGKVFAGYLRLVPACANCGAPLGRLRADDAPPYFVIFLVGHLLVPGVFWVERVWQPPMWVHMAVWLPLFTVLCILLLRPVKGAVVGWMSALGFVGAEPEPEPAAAAPRHDA